MLTRAGHWIQWLILSPHRNDQHLQASETLNCSLALGCADCSPAAGCSAKEPSPSWTPGLMGCSPPGLVECNPHGLMECSCRRSVNQRATWAPRATGCYMAGCHQPCHMPGCCTDWPCNETAFHQPWCLAPDMHTQLDWKHIAGAQPRWCHMALRPGHKNLLAHRHSGLELQAPRPNPAETRVPPCACEVLRASHRTEVAPWRPAPCELRLPQQRRRSRVEVPHSNAGRGKDLALASQVGALARASSAGRSDA